LSFLHAGNVILERNLVFSGLAGVEAEEFSELQAVGSVFVDTELDVL